MPHLQADNSAALAAVLFALAWLGFWADRQRFSDKLPGVPCVIGAGMLLSAFGLIPSEAPIYGFVGQYIMPLGVPFLLFKANLRSVIRDGGVVLVGFLIASVGVCVGSITGYFLLDLGEYGAKAAAGYSGAFIGGVVNLLAISQAVGMTPTQFSVALSASAPASILGLLTLVSLPGFAVLRRWMPSPEILATPAGPALDREDAGTPFRLDHIAAAIALGFGICAASNYLCDTYNLGTYQLLVVTALTVIVANVAPRKFAQLEGDFSLGILCMYIFFAMIGASTDPLGFVRSAPMLFVYCSYVIAVQFVVLIAAGRLFKLDLAEMVIGSAAAIVGSAAAAAIASAKGWRTLVTAAITVGMLGYAIANFIGLAIYELLT